MILIALLAILGLAVLAYGVALARAAVKRRVGPSLEATLLGVIVNFFDALGIGSFATTAAWLIEEGFSEHWACMRAIARIRFAGPAP